ncbi:MAG: hypothetical protein J5944_13030 [Lentisphaeria bacterium]|nr:hypothetical protein [Lentisphaeria bacterium]
MLEQEYIAMFAGIHGLNPFSADAEHFGNRAVSMDSFSETEDFFTHTPPEIIGHNLAAGACTDLLACGVRPEILIQSWNLDDSRPMEYYGKIASGIESVLRHYGARCIGGDLGCARPWSWTAAVSAECVSPVTRTAKSREPFDLYISGPMGKANLAAVTGEAMPEIPLREPVPSGTLFATDTSGGFFDALENFRRVNTGMNLFFDVEKVLSQDIPQSMDFDRMSFLVGGVGEYELIYAVPRGMPVPGIRIGEGDFTSEEENMFCWGQGGQWIGRMKNPPPDYRNIRQEEWVKATMEYLREMMS